VLGENPRIDGEHAVAELGLCGLRSLAAVDRALTRRPDLAQGAELASRCREQLRRLLEAAPGPGIVDADVPDLDGQVMRLRAAVPTSRLGRLRRALSLDDVDISVLMMAALSNELDTWAALFRLLGGSPWPRVHHLLDLLGQSFGREAVHRAVVESPLTRYGLIRVEPIEAPFSSRVVCIDSYVWEALRGRDTVPPLLRAYVDQAEAPRVPLLPPDLAATVERLAVAACTGTLERVVLNGPPGVGRRTVARHLAPCLVELRLPSEPPSGWGAAAVRHALGRGAALLLVADSANTPIEIALDLPPRMSAFLVAPEAADVCGATFGDAVRLRLPNPSLAERIALWRAALADHGLPALDAAELARSYHLSGGEIVATARTAARLHGMETSRAAVATIVRERPAARLSGLLRGRRPRSTWDDLILPNATIATLREMAERVRHRDRVFGEWKIAGGATARVGLLSLFVGATGTGKTLAAEVIAHQLELDLYCIDVSLLVSKYIGETEKNLSRIFDAVEGAPAVLFFDEADSLFGKRTETRDAHDRYANLEVSYLLARLESFSGIAIMASNFRQNIDAAFLRRFDYVVEFAQPDLEARRRIWERHLGCEAPLAPDLNTTRLAEVYEISGAHIRNAIVGAAFAAASEERPIHAAHIVAAMRREYEKLGKPFPARR
jgi:hypothetical protein